MNKAKEMAIRRLPNLRTRALNQPEANRPNQKEEESVTKIFYNKPSLSDVLTKRPIQNKRALLR